MKKIEVLILGCMLLFILSACSSNFEKEAINKNLDQTEQTASETRVQSKEESTSETQMQSSEEINSEIDENLANKLQIRVEGVEGQNIIFKLNDSRAANELYEQLPLSIQVENYSHNEKIFYLPDELDTKDGPLAKGPSGTLAYFEPWGNVVLYYGECGGASGLYALGEAVSGTEQIETLSGEIRIEVVDSE